MKTIEDVKFHLEAKIESLTYKLKVRVKVEDYIACVQIESQLAILNDLLLLIK